MRLQSNTSPKENCLIFRYGNKVIGILHFGLEDQSPLSHAIWERLESASLVVAPVLEAFNQKRELTAAQIADATRSERLAVAQDMHDTIGQNLCYLRLKLDQFSTPEGLRKSDDIRQDMELLRDTANESYELVRGALAILQLEDPLHFVELLQAQGVMIAERAKFEFMLDNVGAPRSLPPEIMRQTFFAMKEALTNISNHALASNVSVQLRWDDIGLTISIADDGIGFEPGQHKTNDHYGLSIMKKRIESVQGCFSVSSTPNVGTDVNIWVPYAMKQQSRLEIQI
jgi:signal transduction histidine kinase